MSAPALARGRTGRRYHWPPKGPAELVVPSVTTILSQLSKPALTNWAAKEVATYAIENILHWQDLPMADALDLLKRAPYRNMTKKGDIGSAVHTAIETWDGQNVVLDNLDLLPYVAAAILFLEENVAEVISQEVTIFNRQYLYAGTADAIVELKDGRVAICDWKTGGIYPEVALQLCAYANGEFIGNMDGTETPLPRIDVGLAVHLPGDNGYTAHEVELNPRLWRTFIALRSIQRWRDDFEGHALGPTKKGDAVNGITELQKKRTEKEKKEK